MYECEFEIDHRKSCCGSKKYSKSKSPSLVHDQACTYTTPSQYTNTNRLNLPFIALQDNKIYRENKNKTKTKLDYHGLKEMERKIAHSEKEFFSINDIYNSKLINPRSRTTRDNKIEEFLLWLTDRRIRGLYAPTIQELKECKQNKQLDKFFDIIPFYFEYRFNKTYNKPNSFDADLSAIKHFLLTEINVSATNSQHFPWYKEFKKGVNNIRIEVLGKDGVTPKLAIFNPMLEAMLKTTKNSYVKLALLLAQRFCFRAQHYLATPSKADFLTLGKIKFRYNKDGSVRNMTVYNKRDKNNKSTYEMERTVYCSCHTDWTCLPCMAEKIVNMRLAYGAKSSDPLIINDKGEHMSYGYLQEAIKAIMKQLGVNPKHYGTHSLRAGGATEMYLAGYNLIDIRNFAWWRAMESVLTYIRPANQDMEKFVPDFGEYCDSRRNKTVMFAEQDEIILAILEKKKHGDRNL